MPRTYSLAGDTDAIAPGSTDTIGFTEIRGDVTGAGVRPVRRRRRAFFISEDGQAPGSEDTIYYSFADGKAVGNAIAAGSKADISTEFISGRAIGQKIFVVSGTVFGNAKAPGSITVIGVSAVESSGTRTDNDFILSDHVIDPVTVDNDLLEAA